MFAVTVEFELKPDRIEPFREAVLAQAKNSLERETGCHQFDVCLAENNRETVFLYEVYENAKAFREHLETAHFTEFDATVSYWVKRKSARTWTRAEDSTQ